MQLAMIDHGGWIVFVDQMSWSTYVRNLLEKLFDIGKESKYHALFEDALFAVPTQISSLLMHPGSLQLILRDLQASFSLVH